MKNIENILADLGIEIPEDKREALNKDVNSNYKTIAEHNKKITGLEAERDDFKGKFEAADTALKGFEGLSPDDYKAKLAEYDTKMQEAQANFNKQLEDRDRNDLLKDELSKIQFSSNAAKAEVEREIRAANLQMVDGKLLGFNDLLESIKAKDADAFAAPEGGKPAKFTKTISGGAGSEITKESIFKEKDTAKRQKMIRENLHLFNEE